MRKTLAVRVKCGGAGTRVEPTKYAIVSLGGSVVWDGKSLVGRHPGIFSATDVGSGVEFETTNGLFSFTATHRPPMNHANR